MFILHVTRDHAPAHCGGTSTAVTGLIRALSQRQIGSCVVSFEQWRPRANPIGAPLKRDEHEGISVVRLSTPDQLPAAQSWALEQAIDLVVVHHEMLWEFGQAVARARNVPCVLVVHVFQAAMNRVRGIEERTMSLVAQEVALEEAAAVIATSKAVEAELLEMYPKLQGRLQQLDLGTHRVAEKCRTFFVPTVVFSGRFDSIKRLSLLLEAMEKVIQVHPEARLLILGGNPGNAKLDRRWRRRLASEISTDLQERTEVTGWLSEDELWQRLGDASIIVVPSLYETFGLSLLEAMARGLAAVVSPAGGLARLVEHSESGYLVDSADPEPWSKAILSLLETPERTLAMGELARQRVEANWHWKAVVKQWEDTLLRLCEVSARKF